MVLAPEIELIVEFIIKNSTGLCFNRWTREQIVTLTCEQIKENRIRAVYDFDDELIGVVFFDPCNARGEFWIEQCWSSSPRSVICMLISMAKEFPGVNTIHAWRGKKRQAISYNVTNLTNKFKEYYGRRESTNA